MTAVRQLISIVDDDESLRRSVRNLLGSVGIDVETFASAESFLESEALDRTGCLILDLRLEGMSGLDLLAQLSARGKPIPTILVTAHGDDEVRQQSMKAGARTYLTKPFRPDDLLRAVREIMDPGAA